MSNHQFLAEGAEVEPVVAAVENLQRLSMGESTVVLAKVDFQVKVAKEVILERMKKEKTLEMVFLQPSRCLLRTAQRTLVAAFFFIYFCHSV